MSAAPILPMDHDIRLVMQVVEQRTLAFLRDEMRLAPTGVERRLHANRPAVLRDITAIVGVGSHAGLYIAYSYDRPLIRAMARIYTEGLTIAPDEEEIYVCETASDVVNLIVGNSTADLTQRGEVIVLSPPVLMVGARSIQSRDGSTVAALTAHFPQGALDIAFVGPRSLFDDHLNYQGAC